MRLLIHTASLYPMFQDNYEKTLDDRIHMALDAGIGVEISNGPEILEWVPHPETRRRLSELAVHAEFVGGVTPDDLAKKLTSLPFDILNVTVHPDEVDIALLSDFPFPISIENMDATRTVWKTVEEMMGHGYRNTVDIAHCEMCGLAPATFDVLRPYEIHLSANTELSPHTALFMADRIPHLPDSCELLTLEGLILSEIELHTEIEYVRRFL